MASVIAHRGPDDEGFFENGETSIGFRRLSIIDVAGGHQPIFNETRDILVVGNGEIYNYRELAQRLKDKGHTLSTRSDIEVIVHLYEEKGADCVKDLHGMFGFAIYDLHEKKLILGRDRLGIKPLYYWVGGGKLAFASEIKSLLECQEIPREPNFPLIDRFVSLRYSPGPDTLFSGIKKLPAGHLLTWQYHELKIDRYWQLSFDSEKNKPDNDYREQFSELFQASVKKRLMSDVPLGAFLSGGIDSSAIVATMSKLVNSPVKTFSVGFEWQGDELGHARNVAQTMGTDHQEIICRPTDLGLLPKIIWHLDEPIGDAIVVPMYLLSQLARKSVKVVLTGEGADETFAGYLPHKVMFWARQYANTVPGFLQRRLVAPLFRLLPSKLLNAAFSYPGELGVRGKQKILDFLALIEKKLTRDEYYFLISLFDARDKALLYTDNMRNLVNEEPRYSSAETKIQGTTYLDQILSLQYENWLPDDILTKQDKMTMANSIEGRVPFLDHTLVEFMHKAPPHLKLKGLTDKVMLREYLGKMGLPRAAKRKKVPFYIPIDQYFGKGPLHEIMETCLSEKSVKKRGIFEWEHVRQLRNSVSKNNFLIGKQLFSLLALELWHRIFIDRESGWL
jgi:asparagine synthase (glutamine-hydrolysing)